MERDIIRLEAELMVLGPPPLPMEISKYSAVSDIPPAQAKYNTFDVAQNNNDITRAVLKEA